MEKYKETKNKHSSDIHEKKIGSNSLKNSAQLSSRAEHVLPYFSKSKHASGSVVKKANNFTGETKSHYKVNSDHYGIKRNSNPIVNALPIENVSKWNFEHCHNINANIYNIHPSLYNLVCPVPEISQFNGVLKYQTSRPEAVPKYAKHKQRSQLSDKSLFNLKNPISNVTVPNCKYQSSSNSSDRHPCSFTTWNSQKTDPYINVANYKNVSANIANEDNLKNRYKCTSSSNELQNTTDLPIFVHSNFSKDAIEVKYCVERNLEKNKLQKCNQIFLNQSNNMFFPALPSNCHGEIQLNSNNSNSMISLEHSTINSEIVNVVTFPKGKKYSSPNMSSTVPQASYADIIRMSSASTQHLSTTNAVDIQKIKKNSSQSLNLLPSKPSQIKEKCNWPNSGLSQPDQNVLEEVNISSVLSNSNEQNIGTPHSMVTSLKKPSFSNLNLSDSKNVTKSDCHITSSPISTELSDESILNSNSFQLTENNTINKSKFSKNDPPVIMNSSSSPQIMSEISFGIEHDEMVRLCANDSNSYGCMNSTPHSECSLLETKICSVNNSDISDAQFQSKIITSTSFTTANQCIDLKSKKIYWSNPDCDEKNDIQPLNQYLACVWKEFEENTKNLE